MIYFAHLRTFYNWTGPWLLSSVYMHAESLKSHDATILALSIINKARIVAYNTYITLHLRSTFSWANPLWSVPYLLLYYSTVPLAHGRFGPPAPLPPLGRCLLASAGALPPGLRWGFAPDPTRGLSLWSHYFIICENNPGTNTKYHINSQDGCRATLLPTPNKVSLYFLKRVTTDQW